MATLITILLVMIGIGILLLIPVIGGLSCKDEDPFDEYKKGDEDK